MGFNNVIRMNIKKITAIIFVSILPVFVRAQEATVQLIETGITNTKNASLGQYLNALFNKTILIVLSLAVIMFMVAGVMYIWPTTGSTQEGKEMFWRVIGAVVLALTGYLILFTINPQLVRFKIDNILPPLGSSNTPSRVSANPDSEPPSSGGEITPIGLNPGGTANISYTEKGSVADASIQYSNDNTVTIRVNRAVIDAPLTVDRLQEIDRPTTVISQDTLEEVSRVAFSGTESSIQMVVSQMIDDRSVITEYESDASAGVI